MEGVQSKLGIEMLCVPNSSATCSQHSPGPGLWEPGVQHGQSLRDGATVLALLADEVAVMDEVVHSPENRGCKERRGCRDQGHTESLGQRCDRNYTCPTSGRRDGNESNMGGSPNPQPSHLSTTGSKFTDEFPHLEIRGTDYPPIRVIAKIE